LKPEPEQVTSLTCGCQQYMIDYPPQRHRHRPHQKECQGKWRWRVNWRGPDRTRHTRRFSSPDTAQQFIAPTSTGAKHHAS